MSEGLLDDRFQPGDTIRIFHEEGKEMLTFDVAERRPEPEEDDYFLEAMLG
jgi:hypothetical protein